jgi:hypothetical protein
MGVEETTHSVVGRRESPLPGSGCRRPWTGGPAGASGLRDQGSFMNPWPVSREIMVSSDRMERTEQVGRFYGDARCRRFPSSAVPSQPLGPLL